MQVVSKDAGGFHIAAEPGATAVMTRDQKGYDVNVVWDDTPLRRGQSHGGYHPDYFELVSEKGGLNPKDLLGMQKPPIDALPSTGIIYGSMAMRSGAITYGPYNWRETPVLAKTYIAAIQRHALAYLDGQECSPDNGVHHFGAIIAGASILADARENGQLVDDRPEPGVAGALIDRINDAIKTSDIIVKGAIESGSYTEEEIVTIRKKNEAVALAAVFAVPTCDVK